MYTRKFNFKSFASEQEVVDFANAEKGRDAVTVLYNGREFVLFYYEDVAFYNAPVFTGGYDEGWPFD